MEKFIEALIFKHTNADAIVGIDLIQELWSGYGSIKRYHLEGGDVATLVVKQVAPPSVTAHPRGWNTGQSHQRKLRSYAVETAWYRDYASRCDERCKLPNCLALMTEGDEVVMLLEDLDAAGYSARRSKVGERGLQSCLSWLANFHATYLGSSAQGLWKIGTYWHLDTRPDELKVLQKEDPQLWRASAAIDQQLNSARFQTLVHGDAKLANFCFLDNEALVAAVDFQYVGAGCGIKDVAYFIGSCLDESACEANESRLLDFYFESLEKALAEQQQSVDFKALEAEWRALYPVAWTDFHRFLKGWSPGHWKINSYSERLAKEVVTKIEQERTF